jgi:hypothetical protein
MADHPVVFSGIEWSPEDGVFQAGEMAFEVARSLCSTLHVYRAARWSTEVATDRAWQSVASLQV